MKQQSTTARVVLGSIADLTVGFAFKSADFQDGERSVRLLRGVNVSQRQIKWDQTAWVPEELVTNLERYRLRTGDIVVAMDRPWIDAGLKRAVIRATDAPSYLVQRVCRVRARVGVVHGFLQQLIASQAFEAHVKRAADGSTVPHISQSQIAAFSISLPEISTQRKIAAILSAYDDLIENSRRRMNTLEDLAQFLYERIVKSEQGDHAPYVSLGELVSYAARGISPRYGDVGVRVLNQRCVRNKRIDLASSRRHMGAVKSEKLLISGDVLVNSTGVGTLGRVASVTRDIPLTAVDSHVTILRPRSGVGTAYFRHAMMSMESQIAALGRGSTGQIELSKGDLLQLKLRVPPVEVRERFEGEVDHLIAMRDVLLDQTESLAAQRDLLLPRLISGELDVSELDIDTGRIEEQENLWRESTSV